MAATTCVFVLVLLYVAVPRVPGLATLVGVGGRLGRTTFGRTSGVGANRAPAASGGLGGKYAVDNGPLSGSERSGTPASMEVSPLGEALGGDRIVYGGIFPISAAAAVAVAADVVIAVTKDAAKGAPHAAFARDSAGALPGDASWAAFEEYAEVEAGDASSAWALPRGSAAPEYRAVEKIPGEVHRSPLSDTPLKGGRTGPLLLQGRATEAIENSGEILDEHRPKTNKPLTKKKLGRRGEL